MNTYIHAKRRISGSRALELIRLLSGDNPELQQKAQELIENSPTIKKEAQFIDIAKKFLNRGQNTHNRVNQAGLQWGDTADVSAESGLSPAMVRARLKNLKKRE